MDICKITPDMKHSDLLAMLEKQTKTQMNNKWMRWYLDTYFPSILSIFKTRKPMPSRYVSQQEGERAMARINGTRVLH